MQPSVTRRAFLGTVVGAGILAFPLAERASAAPNTLYQLSADWGAGDASCVPNRGQAGCGGCYACVSHARNKIFATAAAADNGRSHPRCKCVVLALETVDAATYQQLFAAGASADRRTPGVNALLAARSAPAPAPALHAPLAFTGASLLPLALGGAGAVAVGAAFWRAGRTTVPALSEISDNDSESSALR
jgi:hypothetical protein